MNREEFERMSSAQVDGGLTPSQRRELECVMNTSPDLRRFHRDLENLDRQLRDHIRRPRLSPDFSRVLRERIRRESVPEHRRALRQQLEAEYRRNLARLRNFRRRPAFAGILEFVAITSLVGIGWACVLGWLGQVQALAATPLGELMAKPALLLAWAGGLGCAGYGVIRYLADFRRLRFLGLR